MMYTVRLTPKEEKLLAQAARESSTKRSELVREAIAEYCAAKLKRARRPAYEAMASSIGCARSGRGDLAERAHELFRKALLEKRRSRSG